MTFARDLKRWLLGPARPEGATADHARALEAARAYLAEAAVALDPVATRWGEGWHADTANAAAHAALDATFAALDESRAAPAPLRDPGPEALASARFEHAQALVEAGTEALGGPGLRAFHRGLRVALVALVAAGVGLTAKRVRAALRPELAAAAAWRASSATAPYLAEGRGFHPLEGRPNIFFQTAIESEPWLRFDLGVLRPVSTVWVQNRLDDHQDWAVPLTVEGSRDGRSWQTFCERREAFYFYRCEAQGVAVRYVRLRVQRPTMLNLGRVEIR
ncbi:MAG: discoidin domain-containing protein [Myxococcales bacterium]|nr:discoidin domain-containing protein [Myxococcales bacterium]